MTYYGLHDEIETALSSWKEPQVDETRIEELKDKIAKISMEARLKESAKRGSIEAKNREELSQIKPLQLTAMITWINTGN
ncbi:MAG: hypothetical protein IPM82_13625 [Saprospiraceae bacterium]|nr:hypothetical protein [Saprospiraceae bacterium]